MNDKNENKKEASKEVVKEILKDFVAQKVFYNQSGEELIIRIGDAAIIEVPKGLAIPGAINGPSEFWLKRKKDHNPQMCHVTYDRNEGRISLHVNETTKEGHSIVGKVVVNPDLDGMEINSNKVFTCKELMDHLKFNRVLLKDRDVNSKIVNQLQMFKAKVVNEKEKSDDHKGNQKNINNFQLETSFEERFLLKCPIFKGGQEKEFWVDVLVSVSDGDVIYWLESRELKELESSEKWRLLDDELKHFTEIVCIEQ